MEVGRNLLSSPASFPTRTHLRNGPSSSSSVVMLHDQVAPGVTSIGGHFPTSVLLQEQREEYKLPLHMFKEDKTPQLTMDRRPMENGASLHGDKDYSDANELLRDFEQQLLHWPGLESLLAYTQTGEDGVLSLTSHTDATHAKKPKDVKPCNAIAIAKQALSASKQAVRLAESPNVFQSDIDDSFSTRVGSTSSSDCSPEKGITVRSTRLLERRTKNRKVSKVIATDDMMYSTQRATVKKKLSESFDHDDPLRLFLWGPETRQLLTAKEESELIVHVQSLTRLEEVKSKFRSQFAHEPTLAEWADAMGLTSQALQSELNLGNRSRTKLINANLRMVVHIAKQHLNRGLNFQDLLQVGSLGLMKSVEKFKPQAGCRFATYAYWWIRQSIRKAIFQHSRTIRLPENVYNLMAKVKEARRSCIREGNYDPSTEELAKRVGITVQKLEQLQSSTRTPLSMQQSVWADQDTTFQEITADNGIETPEISVSKQLMRQHVRNLLNVLSPKERKVIRLRYGILDGKQRTLTEIGDMFGLSKERIRQVENGALNRLKQCLNSHGLGAYADMLI